MLFDSNRLTDDMLDASLYNIPLMYFFNLLSLLFHLSVKTLEIERFIVLSVEDIKEWMSYWQKRLYIYQQVKGF